MRQIDEVGLGGVVEKGPQLRWRVASN
jgi:hypothetical protein